MLRVRKSFHRAGSLRCNYYSSSPGWIYGPIICRATTTITTVGATCPLTAMSTVCQDIRRTYGNRLIPLSTCTLTAPSGTPSPVPSPAPSASPAPSPVPSPAPAFSWVDHQCGTGGLAPSMMPSPVPSGVASFTQLMNPMAACCWNGWCQTGSPASCKLDCINAMPGDDAVEFYNAEPRPNVDTNANVAYPNRLFLLDRFGVPYNGFYNSKGARCSYRSPGTTTPLLLTAPAQMQLFDDAIRDSKPPAQVDPDCCNLTIFALERTCPLVNPSNGKIFTVSPPDSTVTRCTAAESLRGHFLLYDICDPTKKKRARFHGVTSLEYAPNTDVIKTEPIDLQKIIQGTFPPGTCPEGFVMDPGNICRIN